MEAGGAPPEPKQLTCDRPFGYAVLHLPTLTLLFVGVVADPTRVTGAARGLSFREAKEQLVGDFERRFLLDALRRNGGNITRAAEEVGMYRQSFQQKMRELGITPDDAA